MDNQPQIEEGQPQLAPPISSNIICSLLKKPPLSRSEEDISKIQQEIQLVKFFAEYAKEDEIMRKCCRFIQAETFQEGETVFEIDSIGEKFYVIFEGQIEIFVRVSHFSSELKKVKVLNNGDSFGEIALIYKRPRLATIKCSKDTVFGVLQQKHFKNTLQQYETEKMIQEMEPLFKMPLFSKWEPLKLRDLFLNSVWLTMKKGKEVYCIGDKPDSMYVIQEGEFQVYAKLQNKNNSEQNLLKPRETQRGKFGQYFKVRTMCSGEFFGEEEMIQKCTRKYTVTCNSFEGKVLMIQKDQVFHNVLQDRASKMFILSRLKEKESKVEERINNMQSSLKEYQQYLFQQDKSEIQSKQFLPLKKIPEKIDSLPKEKIIECKQFLKSEGLKNKDDEKTLRGQSHSQIQSLSSFSNFDSLEQKSILSPRIKKYHKQFNSELSLFQNSISEERSFSPSSKAMSPSKSLHKKISLFPIAVNKDLPTTNEEQEPQESTSRRNSLTPFSLRGIEDGYKEEEDCVKDQIHSQVESQFKRYHQLTTNDSTALKSNKEQSRNLFENEQQSNQGVADKSKNTLNNRNLKNLNTLKNWKPLFTKEQLDWMEQTQASHKKLDSLNQQLNKINGGYQTQQNGFGKKMKGSITQREMSGENDLFESQQGQFLFQGAQKRIASEHEEIKNPLLNRNKFSNQQQSKEAKEKSDENLIQQKVFFNHLPVKTINSKIRFCSPSQSISNFKEKVGGDNQYSSFSPRKLYHSKQPTSNNLKLAHFYGDYNQGCIQIESLKTLSTFQMNSKYLSKSFNNEIGIDCSNIIRGPSKEQSANPNSTSKQNFEEAYKTIRDYSSEKSPKKKIFLNQIPDTKKKIFLSMVNKEKINDYVLKQNKLFIETEGADMTSKFQGSAAIRQKATNISLVESPKRDKNIPLLVQNPASIQFSHTTYKERIHVKQADVFSNKILTPKANNIAQMPAF